MKNVYRVFAYKLEAVRPEMIVTQSQCEVCAVSLSDVEDAVCRMVSSQPRIVSLEPTTSWACSATSAGKGCL